MHNFEAAEGTLLHVNPLEVSYVCTNTNNPFVMRRWPIRNGESGRVVIDMVVVDEAGNSNVSAKQCRVKKTMAGVLSVSNLQNLMAASADQGMTACDYTIKASEDNSHMEVEITGIAGKPLRWLFNLRMVSVWPSFSED